MAFALSGALRAVHGADDVNQRGSSTFIERVLRPQAYLHRLGFIEPVDLK